LTSLDQLAEVTQRSRTQLAEEALQQYLEVQRWQLEGIRGSIAEADSGTPGVPHDRVAEWLESWGGTKNSGYRSRSARCGSSGAPGRSMIWWRFTPKSSATIRVPPE
jgi:RHH-type transcriptional regulator, rel operon repressor / antitoxin RelB